MIIIPTYNEKGNVRTLVEKIRAVLPDMSVVFVDDSSPDGTAEEIKNLQKTDDKIYLIQRPQKSGFASAHLDGIKFALEYNPSVVITMDADLSHDPGVLKEMHEALEKFDLVIGSRYIPGGGTMNWNLWRRLLSRWANFYGRNLTGLQINDVTSGFMAYRTDLLRRIDFASIKSQGYAYLMEIKKLVVGLTTKIKEVPILFVERTEGKSKISNHIVWEGVYYPLQILWDRYKRWESKLVFGTMLVLLSLVVYISTAPRAVYLGDSGEYIAAAATLGIPHPSGNPAYVLLAYLFTWLPLGTPAFEVSMFSAVSASIGLGFFYLIFAQIAKKIFPKLNQSLVYLAAFATALVLAFSEIFWSQAIMAKVYAPTFALVLAVVYLLIKYLDTPKDGYIYASLFLTGLGAGLHGMVLLILPINILWVYMYKNSQASGSFWRQKFRHRFLGVGLLMFLLGLTVLLYLPIRASFSPEYNFSQLFNISNPAAGWKEFYYYIVRSDYSDVAQTFNLSDKLNFFSGFFQSEFTQFSWLLLLAPFGLVWLWLKDKKIFALTLLMVLINSVGLVLLRSTEWNFENDFFQSFYYLIAYGLTAVWIGLGFLWLYDFLQRRQAVVGLILVLIFAASPLALLRANHRVNDLSRFDFAEEYSRKILESLPPNAVLLAVNDGVVEDSLLFNLYYQQTVHDLRPDVTILNSYDIHREVSYEVVAWVYGLKEIMNRRFFLTSVTLKDQRYAQRPIYTTFLADGLYVAGANKDQAWRSCSNGVVYQLLVDTSASCKPDYVYVDDEKDQTVLKANLFGQDILAQYKYSQAAYLLEQGQFHQSQLALVEAIKYDSQISNLDYNAYRGHRINILNINLNP